MKKLVKESLLEDLHPSIDTEKAIIVKNYVKFQSLDKKEIRDYIQNVYKQGYWNVFYYSPELENFLVSNDVDFRVKEQYPFVGENLVSDKAKENFLAWLDKLMVDYPDEEWEWIVSTLVNDETSSDTEIVEYFEENGVNASLAMELVGHREGFLWHGLDIHI